MNRETPPGHGGAVPRMPMHETPAFRLAEHSPEYLSDAELLSLLLKGHAGTERSLRIARQVIAGCGGVTGLARMTHAELVRIPGIGECGAEAIQGALALARRLQRGDPADKPVMGDPQSVARYMQAVIGHLRQEEFHALLLNAKNRLVRDCMITRGLADCAPVHAREVFRPAIQECCSRVILAHNHPSGDATPSPQDISSTGKLADAGKIIGIEVLDHVIIGSPSRGGPFWCSMREGGFLQ